MRIGDVVMTPDGRIGILICITQNEYTVSINGGGVENFDFVMQYTEGN